MSGGVGGILGISLAPSVNIDRIQFQPPPVVITKSTLLFQNYPNPFNPETWMPYELHEGAYIMLTIYDVTGTLVRSIQVGYQPEGIHVSRDKAIYWDGRSMSGEYVGSGVYFYRFQAGRFTATRKMIVLK